VCTLAWCGGIDESSRELGQLQGTWAAPGARQSWGLGVLGRNGEGSRPWAESPRRSLLVGLSDARATDGRRARDPRQLTSVSKRRETEAGDRTRCLDTKAGEARQSLRARHRQRPRCTCGHAPHWSSLPRIGDMRSQAVRLQGLQVAHWFTAGVGHGAV
jgi:hypothetical protein